MSDAIERLVGLVDVKKHEEPADAVGRALELIHFDFKRSMKTIVIKPNLCYYWESSTGETTDPRFVEGIIDLFRRNCDPEEILIVESDATSMRTKHCFKMLGYEELADRKGVKLVNLCEAPSGPSEDQGSDAFSRKIRIPEILKKADVFISVPKLKIHWFTGLSCALKNQFGCIPVRKKIDFHAGINKAIALINKSVTPDLIIVDGIVFVGEKNPVTRHILPRRLNLVIAGYNPVTVDCVAAKILGLDSRKIGHIVESERIGVGPCLAECKGEDYRLFAERIPREPAWDRELSRTLVRLYGFYLRLSGSN